MNTICPVKKVKRKKRTTKSTRWFESFVMIQNVGFQITALGKSLIAVFALEIPQTFVNILHVEFQCSLAAQHFSTQVAGKS